MGLMQQCQKALAQRDQRQATCVCDLVIHTLFLKLFSIIGYYKVLTIVPHAIQ